MNYIKKLRFCFNFFLLVTTILFSGLVLAEEEKPYVPKKVDIYEGFPDWYKAVFRDNVGLKEGAGLFKDYYKPLKMQMYFSPLRHYEPPELLDHTIFIEKERRDLCIICHDGINTGAVADWKRSAHYNPRKSDIIARKTSIIEGIIGREIDSVDCFDCHVNTETKKIRMPSAEECSECHARQVKELVSEKDHGRPNHIQAWEANVLVPWYPEAYRRGWLAGNAGCDMCHGIGEKCDPCHTRHTFSAAEARRPEACMTCHMGPDHPDAESYRESKHGIIYGMEEEHYNFEKPLAHVIVGEEYRTPTCQFCHMYQGGGRFTHNFVSKGIWRMGTTPPSNIEYESTLKDYPFGIKIISDKIDIYSDENLDKRDKWIELCSNCHSPRFADIYLEQLDDYMFQAFSLTDKAQKIIDDLITDGLLYTTSEEETDIYPFGDKITEVLGPELLGEAVWGAFNKSGGKVPVIGPTFGGFALFYQGENYPTAIERSYAKMWFWYKLQGYKGYAHAQQDIMWWWGQSPMLQELGNVQAEAKRIRREAAIEKKLGIGYLYGKDIKAEIKEQVQQMN
jgi:hydroxylamine dehydrogenase